MRLTGTTTCPGVDTRHPPAPNVVRETGVGEKSSFERPLHVLMHVGIDKGVYATVEMRQRVEEVLQRCEQFDVLDVRYNVVCSIVRYHEIEHCVRHGEQKEEDDDRTEHFHDSFELFFAFGLKFLVFSRYFFLGQEEHSCGVDGNQEEHGNDTREGCLNAAVKK